MTPKQKQIILENIGMIVQANAVKNCPIDTGHLRASIKYRIEGDQVIIYSPLDYAEDMEYGFMPRPLSEADKENLTEWAKRHNLNPSKVIKNIQKYGVAPYGSKDDILAEHPYVDANGNFRPFLRSAVHQSIPQIKRMIKEVLA